MFPTPNLFLTLSGGLIYHDNQVQLENLHTIISIHKETIVYLLDKLEPPYTLS